MKKIVMEQWLSLLPSVNNHLYFVQNLLDTGHVLCSMNTTASLIKKSVHCIGSTYASDFIASRQGT